MGIAAHYKALLAATDHCWLLLIGRDLQMISAAAKG